MTGGLNLSVVGNGGGIFTYTFKNPMPNANYSVVAQPTNAVFASSRVYGRTTTGFSVLFQDITPGTTGNVIGADHSVAVFATDGNAGGFWVATDQGTNDEVLRPLNGNADVQLNSLNSGPLAGFRNRIINGVGTAAGCINQRVYVSGTATTAANEYTIDRWRVVTLGQSLPG